MRQEIPWGAAELLKCQFHNSCRVLNCKSREFAGQGLRDPCSHRVTPLLFTGWCQLCQRRHIHICTGMKNKGTCQSEFLHILAESCRVPTLAKETGTQVGTAHFAPGNCFYAVAVSGIGYRNCEQLLAGSTTHPYRPRGKPTSLAGSEEQKRAEEANFMLQSHMRDRVRGLRTQPSPCKPP